MVKTIKNQKKLFFFLKLILFCGVFVLLYNQIVSIDPNEWRAVELKNWTSLLGAIVLVIPNIWFAYRKWTLTLNVLGIPSSNPVKLQSFFAGVVTGMLTPNMLGNFIGRFYYFKREFRIDIILFTMLSNFAQFIASITFGWISVVVLNGFLVVESSKNLILFVGIFVVIIYLSYFYGENFLLRIRKKNYAHRLKATLKNSRGYRPLLLLFSFCRFVVFTFQFALMLNAFGETITFEMILAIWQVYLITMLIPSLFLGKIGIKESISIYILGGLGMNAYSILFASLCIWSLNSLFPAVVGLIVCNQKSDE